MKRIIIFFFVLMTLAFCSKNELDASDSNQNTVVAELFPASFPELLRDYESPLGIDLLYRVINGAYSSSHFNSFFNFSDGPVSHDATLTVFNDYAYVVYSYDVSGRDSAASPTCKVRLKRVNLSDPTDYSEYTVAQKDGTYNHLRQTGGAGQPNMFNLNGVLHILYLAHIEDEYVMMHTTFDTYTELFGEYARLTLSDGKNRGMITTQTLDRILSRSDDGIKHGFQMNSSIGDNNGVYYFGLAYNNVAALIIRTTNFIDYSYVTTMDYGCDVFCEVACWCKNDYLYVTKRLPYLKNDANNSSAQVCENNDGLAPLAKYDLKNNTWVSAVAVKNCSTRPTFFEVDDTVYLITCGPTRSNGQIIAIDNERLTNSRIVSEINNYIVNYASVSVVNEKIYIIGTVSTINIPLCSLELSHFSKKQINDMFLQN